MKYRLAIFAFLAIILGMVSMVGCGDPYSKLKLEVSSDELIFDLDSEADESKATTFTATVNGASGDMVSGLILELSDQTVAAVSVASVNKNKYTINVVAKGAGEASLTIKTKESAQVRYDNLKIVVKKEAETLSNASKKFAVKRGSDLKLTLDEMLRVNPERIYPAVANFSILPTPSEARADETLSVEDRETISNLWDSSYGETRLAGVSVRDNVLTASLESEVGVVQILAEVNGLYSAFPVLVYERINEISLYEVNKDSVLGNPVSIATEPTKNIKLATTASSSKLYAVVLDNTLNVTQIRVEEVYENTNYLNVGEVNELQIDEKQYMCFGVGAFDGGNTTLRVYVDLLYQYDEANYIVFSTLEKDYPVKIDIAVSGINLKCNDGVYNEEQHVYRVQSSYANTKIGENFVVELIPRTATEASFSMSMPVDAQGDVSVYVDTAEFANDPSEESQLIKYDWTTAPATRLKGNATIYIKYDGNGRSNTHFSLTVYAGFEDECEAVYNFEVVDSVKSLNVNQSSINLLYDAGSSTDNQRAGLFSVVAETSAMDTVFNITSSKDIVSVVESSDYHRELSEGRLTVTYLVKAKAEGSTVIEIASLNGRSVRLVCNCYLNVVNGSSAKLYVLDQTKNNVLDIDDAIIVGQELEFSMRQNKTVGIGYQMFDIFSQESFNELSYKFGNVVVSREVEPEVYEEIDGFIDVDLSEIKSKHIFSLTPTSRAEDMTFKIDLTILFEKYVDHVWSEDNVELTIILHVVAPFKDMTWARVTKGDDLEEDTFDVLGQYTSITLYPQDGIYKDDTSWTHDLFFAFDSNIDSGIDVSYSVDWNNGTLIHEIDNSYLLVDTQTRLSCTKITFSLLSWPTEIETDAIEIVVTLTTSKFREVKQLNCYIMLRKPLQVTDMKLTGVKKYVATNDEGSYETRNVELNSYNTKTTNNITTYYLAINKRIGYSHFDEIEPLVQINPLNALNTMYGMYIVRDDIGSPYKLSDFIKFEAGKIKYSDIVVDGVTAKYSGVVTIYLYPLDREVEGLEIGEDTILNGTDEENPSPWPFIKIVLSINNGEDNYPYQIYDEYDFMDIYDLSANRADGRLHTFVLKNNIDLNRLYLNNDARIEKLGSYFEFQDILRSDIVDNLISISRQYVVSGIRLKQVAEHNNENYVGLFSVLSGFISNVNFNIVADDLPTTDINNTTYTIVNYCGLLAGMITNPAKLEQVRVQGSITGANITGVNTTGVNTTDSDTNVIYIGGIAGYVDANVSIDKVKFLGKIDITLSQNGRVGGMFGKSLSSITNNGNNTEFRQQSVDITIEAQPNVLNNVAIGGLVGEFANDSQEGTTDIKLENVTINGKVAAPNLDRVGGVVGLNAGTTITNVNTSVNVVGHSAVGGVVGYNTGNLENVIAENYVSDTMFEYALARGYSNIGGLIGHSFGGGISYSYVQSYPYRMFKKASLVTINDYIGDVWGDSAVGGLVGFAQNTSISSCFANINIQLNLENGPNYLGGLIGICEGGSISYAYANCRTFKVSGKAVGQLIGKLTPYTEVDNNSTTTSYSEIEDVYGYVFDESNKGIGEIGYLPWCGNIGDIIEEDYQTLDMIDHLQPTASSNNKEDLQKLSEYDENSGDTIYYRTTGKWIAGVEDENDNLPRLTKSDGVTPLNAPPVISIKLTPKIQVKQGELDTRTGVEVFDNAGVPIGLIIDLSERPENETGILLGQIAEIEILKANASDLVIVLSDSRVVELMTEENEYNYNFDTNKIKPNTIGSATITVISKANPSVRAELYINVINTTGFGVKRNADDVVNANQTYNVRINESQVLQGYYQTSLDPVAYGINEHLVYGYTVDGTETILAATQNFTIDINEEKTVSIMPYWKLYFGGELFFKDFYKSNEGNTNESNLDLDITFVPYHPILNFDVSYTDASPSSGESTYIVSRVDADDVSNTKLAYEITNGDISKIESVETRLADTNSKYKELCVEVYLKEDARTLSSDLVYTIEFTATTTNGVEEGIDGYEEYEVYTKAINITFVPAVVNKVNLSFYTKGLDVLEQGSEMPSLSISAAEQGILQIEVVQDYADFDYCAIYPTNTKGSVVIQQLVKKYENSIPIIHNLETTYINGGVFIGKYSELVGNSFSPYSGVMYARVLIGSEFAEGDECTLVVELFKNGNPTPVGTATIVLVADFVSHATLSLDQSTQSSFIENSIGLGTQAKLILEGEFRNCSLNRVDIRNNVGTSILAKETANDLLYKCFIKYEDGVDISKLGSSSREVVKKAFWIYVGPSVTAETITIILDYTQNSVADKLPYNLTIKLKLYVVNFQITSADVVGLNNGVLLARTKENTDLKVNLNYIAPISYDKYKNYENIVSASNTVTSDEFANAIKINITDKVKIAADRLDTCVDSLIWQYKPFNSDYTSISIPQTKTSYGDFYLNMTSANENFILEGINSVSDLMFKLKFNFGYTGREFKLVKNETISGLINNEIGEIDFEFKVNIIGSTVVNEHPTPIDSAAGLRGIASGGNYILSNDIDLGSDWTPLDLLTNDIGSTNTLTLDGNGYIIKLSGLVIPNETTSIGVFGNIGSRVVLTNIIVDVGVNIVNLQERTNLNFGFLAGRNEGVIYNCDVLTTHSGDVSNISAQQAIAISLSNNDEFDSQKATADQLLSNENPTKYSVYILVNKGASCNMGGLVGLNNGYITNCRVGRLTEDVSTLRGTDKRITQGINIFGYGNLGGLVGVNNRIISNSYYKNGDIINYANSNSSTGGFVARNNSTGLISGCYSEGRRAEASNQPRVEYGGVRAAGTVGGFVHTNAGQIENSYSNINMISSSICVGGFVYENLGSSRINNCYSACEVNESTTTSGVFIGRDIYGVILNDPNAQIANSYYYTDQLLANNPQIKYVSPIAIKGWSDRTGEAFTGFVFSQKEVDCMWMFDTLHTSFGPQLTFANTVYYSHRDVANNYAYPENEGLGTKYNPILITSFYQENSYSSWVSVFENNTIVSDAGRFVYNGVYISLLRDISFIGREEYTHSFQTQFGGILNGNGYTLSNLGYNSSEAVEDFGLFQTINGGQIHNFNLSVGNFSSKAQNFGALAGSIKGNSFIDNVKINGGNLNGEQNIGGLAGVVSDNSFVQYVKVQNINITASGIPPKEESPETVIEIPSENEFYVGGVAGKITLTASEDNTIDNSPRIYSLIVDGINNINGYVVGGVVGYIGADTEAYNLAFFVEPVTELSGSKLVANNSAYLGGVVGRLDGILSSGYIGANIVSQKKNDALGNYIGYTDLFLNNTSTTGGLVGVLNGGTLQYSYSRAGVYANVGESHHLGSIIGIANSGSITEVYTLSNIDIVGCCDNGVEESGVILINDANPANLTIATETDPDATGTFSGYNPTKWVLKNGEYPTLLNNYIFNVVIPEEPEDKTYLDSFIDALKDASSNTTIKLERDLTITKRAVEYEDTETHTMMTEIRWAMVDNGEIKPSNYAYRSISELRETKVTGALIGQIEEGNSVRNAKITFVEMDETFVPFFGDIDNFTMANVDFDFQFNDNTTIETNSFGLLSSDLCNSVLDNINISFSNLNSITQANHDDNLNVGMISPVVSNTRLNGITIVGDETGVSIAFFDDKYVNVGGVFGLRTQGQYLAFNRVDVSGLKLSAMCVDYDVHNTSDGNLVSLGGLIGYTEEAIQVNTCGVISSLTCDFDNYANTAKVYVGGLVGCYQNERSYIKSCNSNQSTITVSNVTDNLTLYVGGLAGYMAGSIQECNLQTDITIVSSIPAQLTVGGLVGYVSNTHDQGYIPVRDNSFGGNITISNSGKTTCGGIIGQYDMNFKSDSPSTECTMMYNCIFSGNIIINDSDSETDGEPEGDEEEDEDNSVSGRPIYVGGILGQSKTIKSNSVNFEKFLITNLQTTEDAQITLSYTSPCVNYTYIGGIAGMLECGVKNSSSAANISVTRNKSEKKRALIGGLVASMQNSIHEGNNVTFKVSTSNVAIANVKVIFAIQKQEADLLKTVTGIEFYQYGISNAYNLDPRNKLDLNELGLNNYFNIDKIEAYLYDKKTKLIIVSEGKIVPNTNMTNMFVRIIPQISQITSIKLDNLDTSEVTNMSGLFYGCAALTSLDLSALATTKVANMRKMFAYCTSLANIKFGADFGSNATNMGYMFYGCTALENLDITNFNTSKVTNMNYMFYNCSNLSRIYLESTSSWSVENVASSTKMFGNCDNLVGYYQEITIDPETEEQSIVEYQTPYDSEHIDKEYARLRNVDTEGYFTNKQFK